MFKISFLTITLAMILNPGNITAQGSGKKMLIAYYSWSGNTLAVANHIRSATGADIFVIEPQEAYSSVYNECVEQAKKDINAGYKPVLKGKVADIDSYDIIFVGTPNWWSTVAPPVLTFFTEHNLSGKTVIPFVTHGGGREARCFIDMAKAAPQADFLKGFVVSGNRAGSSKADVEKWLGELGITK